MPEETSYRVLVPVSLPSASRGLIHVASALALPGRDLDVCALHIESSPARTMPPRKRQESADLRDEVLGAATQAGSRLGLPIRTASFPSKDVAASIMDFAAEDDADLVVVGWTKPILGRSIPSRTISTLLDRSETDVGVFFQRKSPPWRRVLLPFAGGPHDRLAVDLVGRIVETGAKATVLHIVNPQRAADEQPRLRTTESTGFGDERVVLKVVESWDPLGETVRESRQGYDLIVMGVAPTFTLGRSQFGKEHERIARESDASLLIVRSHRIVAGDTTEVTASETDTTVQPAG
jgi:K+:H+ antiporter